jgi:dTMP kinase
MAKRGLFISFEGGEGVGKSTVIKNVTEKLLMEGINFVSIHEPGGVEISKKIREITHDTDFKHMDYRTEALLMAASRAQLIKEVYVPALDKGTMVLADRYVDSSYAYQSFGRGLDFSEIKQLNMFATEGLLPNKTFLMDAPVATGHERRDQSSQHDRFDTEGIEFFERVRQGYLYLANAEPDRFTIIDATQTQADIADQVCREIKALMVD